MEVTDTGSTRRRADTLVTVREHGRAGGKVHVDAYTRSAPGGGGRRPRALPAALTEGKVAARRALPGDDVFDRKPRALDPSRATEQKPGLRNLVREAQARASENLTVLRRVSPTGAKLYHHYLDGSGEDIWFTREQARQLLPVREAERKIKDMTLQGATGNNRVNNFLLGLRDGADVYLPMFSTARLAGNGMKVFDFFDGNLD